VGTLNGLEVPGEHASGFEDCKDHAQKTFVEEQFFPVRASDLLARRLTFRLNAQRLAVVVVH
jgi:hypothetical protein